MRFESFVSDLESAVLLAHHASEDVSSDEGGGDHVLDGTGALLVFHAFSTILTLVEVSRDTFPGSHAFGSSDDSFAVGGSRLVEAGTSDKDGSTSSEDDRLDHNSEVLGLLHPDRHMLLHEFGMSLHFASLSVSSGVSVSLSMSMSLGVSVSLSMSMSSGVSAVLAGVLSVSLGKSVVLAGDLSVSFGMGTMLTGGVLTVGLSVSSGMGTMLTGSLSVSSGHGVVLTGSLSVSSGMGMMFTGVLGVMLIMPDVFLVRALMSSGKSSVLSSFFVMLPGGGVLASLAESFGMSSVLSHSSVMLRGFSVVANSSSLVSAHSSFVGVGMSGGFFGISLVSFSMGSHHFPCFVERFLGKLVVLSGFGDVFSSSVLLTGLHHLASHLGVMLSNFSMSLRFGDVLGSSL